MSAVFILPFSRAKTEETLMPLWVRVPVLSKQMVLMRAPQIVFSASVPQMPSRWSRTKQKEQLRLKKMGRATGKAQVMKSRNLKKIKIFQNFKPSISTNVPANSNKLTISTSSRKQISFLKNYGCLGVLVRIFLIILPLRDPKPMCMAMARVPSFCVFTIEPQKTQWLLCSASRQSRRANLGMGTDSPVRLASSMNSSPATKIESQGIYCPGTYTSPQARSTFSIVVKAPSRKTVTGKCFSAVYLICLYERQRRMQLIEVVMKPKAIMRIPKMAAFSRMYTTETRYWNMKNGLVIMSNRYQKQFGTSTKCSFFPKNAVLFCTSSFLRPFTAPIHSLGSERSPRGKHTPSDQYRRCLNMKTLLVFPQKSQGWIEQIDSFLSEALTYRCVARCASLGEREEQKSSARRLMQYFRSSRPTTEAVMSTPKKIALGQFSCRNQKSWILHSPQSSLSLSIWRMVASLAPLVLCGDNTKGMGCSSCSSEQLMFKSIIEKYRKLRS